IVSRWTGIPVTRLQEAETARLLRMEEEMHQTVVGQDEAIAVISRAIRRSRAGLKDPKRPIGSFIFSGPTGVGKTELARGLARFLFADASALIRVDMSEYMEKFSVSRLIGAPPGYVGYEDSGTINKAVNPEFLNWVDVIIVFHPLTREHIALIVAILLKEVQRRLGEEELTLRLTPAASDFLVDHGYDEHFGARPLKRAIQKYVEDPLSEKILVGEFARGDEIEVDVAPDKERLAFRALSGSKA